MKNKLFIVIPCYNEEDSLRDTSNILKKKMNKLIKNKKISTLSKVVFINDGSKDNTWNIIEDISKKDKLFTGISLANNVGQQNALTAGLLFAKEYADMVISMDADLQDDVDKIDEMIDKYNEGFEIVYGVRKSRKNDSFFKRTSAHLFYKFMSFMGADIVYNHADFRLTSKRVLDEFSNYKEVNLFLRGLFPLMGFNSISIYYDRKERISGNSKYSFTKMVSLAWNGITSFSIKPLRLICNLGLFILIISIAIMIYSLVRKVTGNTVDGWTFLSISIWFIGGLQMLSLGIVGEYVGKVYSEVKNRPRYIVTENLFLKNQM